MLLAVAESAILMFDSDRRTTDLQDMTYAYADFPTICYQKYPQKKN